LLAITCGLLIANLFVQPIAGLIATDLCVPREQAGLFTTLPLAGYGLGLLLGAPLGDLVENRRLIVSKLADRLIAKSLLVRTADPQDGRAQTLCLTRAGRSMVPKLAALADANDAEFFDHLAPKDRAALLRILREIVEKRGLKSLPVD
jgi:hypothetical protein